MLVAPVGEGAALLLIHEQIGGIAGGVEGVPLHFEGAEDGDFENDASAGGKAALARKEANALGGGR